MFAECEQLKAHQSDAVSACVCVFVHESVCVSLTSSASPPGINGQTVEMDDGKSGYVGSRVDLLCRFINSSPPVKISQVLIAHLNECTMPSVYGPNCTKSEKHSLSGPGGASFVTLPSRLADGCPSLGLVLLQVSSGEKVLFLSSCH